jgi:hypothetical protein
MNSFRKDAANNHHFLGYEHPQGILLPFSVLLFYLAVPYDAHC